jgi:glycerol-3-phosphate dehydrogenase
LDALEQRIWRDVVDALPAHWLDLAGQQLQAVVPRGVWQGSLLEPGGDFAFDGVERLTAETRKSWPFLSDEHARRLVRAYGTRVGRILGSAKSLDDLGECLGADLTAAEVRYQMTHEWAQVADDVLWRRSKLGLLVSREERERLAKFMVDAVGGAAA